MAACGDDVSRYDEAKRQPIYRHWWKAEIGLYTLERQRKAMVGGTGIEGLEGLK